ncbi:uncharacterized protein LOC110423559 [Herrania umbratica]|uniref:Uncharacterized protein LOC110423559 n=1 Tax=Herrania umbratica TaxID=108875 RepID=A0A6J1B2F2_9ROSI|nr:uncharacterized protein LOC110423559 [Herrania umbratica]
MGAGKTSRRGLKICCCVTAIFIVIVAIVLITLAFTVFKPKNPEITVYPQGLENIAFDLQGLAMLSNATANVTVGMIIAINNRNYGSFKFKNTTAFVTYRGGVVAEVPIIQSHVPAHGKLNITTDADFMVDRLISNPSFWADVMAGSVNFTSEATVRGKMTMLKILKVHASVPSSCYISIFVQSQSIESICMTKLKL